MNSITQVQQDLLGRMEQMKQGAEGPVIEASPLFEAPRMLGDSAGQDGFRAAFGDVFKAIDNQQHKASALTAAVDSGASDDLVGAMVESQKASVSFSALMQVRNKVTSAFEEIMRTPL
ncbi:flagellar hook-basal-body complex subunit FliE [Cellvibrio sp. BR]|uniref:flagellar hook-basal body complex protein FliE n=1 Tax=Cellvibrio sp. BR TaxID=1134474 RepID=UPI00026011CB|nr:flagellar hook-basal body complex protein FliE [Cellvibrio sp. BR]EIK45715.1 flagellar hook-basal-body complex subunit FliE [Cellvibrio sp. BR]